MKSPHEKDVVCGSHVCGLRLLDAAVIIYAIMRSAQSFQKKCRAALIQMDPSESLFSPLVHSLKPETLE